MNNLLISIFGEFYGNMLTLLLSATQWTIYLSLTAFVCGGLIGLVFTIFRISPVKTLKIFATAYIWLFQSIPLLMLLFILGLGIPVFFGINMPSWLAAGIALTLFTSAYISEVWRGALQSIPKGQWEGGQALGMNFTQILILVIVPQAIKLAIPSTVGFMIQVIKGTSMAYIIDFNDLMRWGKKIANSQMDGAEPFIVFPIVALIYFTLCFPLSCLAKRLEESNSQP